MQLCRWGPILIIVFRLVRSLVYLFDRPILPFYNKGTKLSLVIIVLPWFFNIYATASHSFCKLRVRSVRSVCDPFDQFREPVPFITIRLIRARIIFLKHQDSFRVKFVFKKIKFVFEKTKLVFKKIKIRVQKDNIRVPCTASSAIPVICVYVHAHTYALACVYFIR